MNIIIAGSYLNIPAIIDIIEREKSDFRILSIDDTILDLFAELYGSEKVYKIPKVFDDCGNLVSLFLDLASSFTHKKKLLSSIIHLGPRKIFFFSIGWCGLSCWLIKKLSRSCDVYYRPEVNFDSLREDRSLRMRIKTAIASMICGTKLKPGIYFGYSLIAIDRKFLVRVKSKIYKTDINHNNIRSFLSERFDSFKDAKILVLNGGTYNVYDEEYVKVMRNVADILFETYDNTEICIKDHPTDPIVEVDSFVNLLHAPRHLPASLLCYTFKTIISYNSATLYEAANLGKKSICLVHMVPKKTDNQGDNVINYLKRHLDSGKIEFPQDLKDFRELINEEKN